MGEEFKDFEVEAPVLTLEPDLTEEKEEIAKKEQIAADLKQSIKKMGNIEESEEISGKDWANIIKRRRRYQELQKEIEDMRKAIF